MNGLSSSVKMAAPVRVAIDHHRRKKTCDVRPAYRDGRREKAVKVYTVNQESRFLLIQGVPDINVTEELLKLLSLYGTIKEYQILQDYPAEPFTKVYWVKYADIQAAKVAKRKTDDRPFYGGILHVSYAPEYESVEDTRCKLQERRKDVARRLRKLQHESREMPLSTSHGRPTTSTTHGDNNPLALRSSSKTPTDLDSIKSQLHVIGPSKPPDSPLSKPNPSIDLQQAVNDSSETSVYYDVHNEEIPQQLPAPPRPLPVWEWEDPVTSHDQYPRLRTAHATLPHDFNPYPDGYEPPRIYIQQDSNSSSSHEDGLSSALLTNTVGDPVMHRATLDIGKAGARPKFKLGHDRRLCDGTKLRTNQPPRSKFLQRVAWRNDNKVSGQASSDQTESGDGTVGDYRTCPPTLKRPHPNQYPNPSAQISSVPDCALPNPQTSSIVPRQLLGKRKHPTESAKPEQLGFGSGEGGPGRSERRSDSCNVDLSGAEEPLHSGNVSFDRTVQNIRQQMRNVAQAAGDLSNAGRLMQQAQQQAAVGPAAPAAPAGESSMKRLRI